jgi:NADPH oxidase
MAAYFSKFKRSSGLDFSDRGQLSNLDQHPDLKESYANGTAQPSHLQRNKSERRRLQPLQRTATIGSASKGPHEPERLIDKLNVWMINDGGRRLFFSVWIFLHLLVFSLGFVNYQLNDDNNNARAMYGYGFSTWVSLHNMVLVFTQLFLRLRFLPYLPDY